MLMFQRDYVERLLEIGERDAEARGAEIRRLVAAAEAPVGSPLGETDTSLRSEGPIA